MAQKSNEKKKTLTLEEKRELFLKPCKTKKELKAWIKYFLDLDLPDVTVSRYSDTNPLDVIWEVYSICVLKNNPQKIQELLFVAGRGSGKTLGMAVAELMVLLHDQRDVVHVGAILSQAERCYNYQKNFLFKKHIQEIVAPEDVPEEKRILEKSNMSKTVFNLGGEKVTLEVLPMTLKACLTVDSLVKLKDGRSVKVCDLKKDDIVESSQGEARVVSNYIDYRPCIRVELDDGRTIEGTLDHKVYTNKGWVELKDLTEEHEVL